MKILKSTFLISLQEAIRIRHYSIRTEKAHLGWAKRFILFHNKRHPSTMGANEVKQFLNFLALEKNVAAATQNQALNALVFMYRHVLEQPFENIQGLVYAKQKINIPVVLSKNEISSDIIAINRSSMVISQFIIWFWFKGYRKCSVES